MRSAKTNRIAPRCLAVIALSFMQVHCIGVLGPTDTPDFKGMEWREMTFTYYVRKSHQGPLLIRSVVIDDAAFLKRARDAMSIGAVGAHSQGNSRSAHIRMADGETWDMGMVIGNRLRLSRRSDNYYSYVITLADDRFFDVMRARCLEHEKGITPGAVLENVIIRADAGPEDYALLPQ